MNAVEKKQTIEELARKLGGPEAKNIIAGIIALCATGPSSDQEAATEVRNIVKAHVDTEVDRVRKEFGDMHKALGSLASIVQEQGTRLNKLENAKKKGKR